MALERAFRRLALQPTTVCLNCRRVISSSASVQQQQSATAAFAAQLQASRDQSATTSGAQSRLRPANPLPNPIATSTPPRTTSEPDRLVPRASYDFMSSVISDTAVAMRRRQEQQRAAEIDRPWDRADLEKQAVRRWKVGDVYAPHDLTGVEQAKWKKMRRRGRQRYDVLDQLGINPIHHYKNFSMMSEFVTDMGRIKHGNETGLRPVNQRRMAKAIRRAIGTGMMPGVYRHPEILRIERKDKDR